MTMIEPPEVAAKTLGQIAYDAVRGMILSGELRPGERLSERDLARRIQVSRTPLREALGRLERDGLAVNKPGLGYFTVEFDPRAVSDIFELRELLELHACRAAAERIGASGIRALDEVVTALTQLEKHEELSVDQVREEVALGFRIHEIIAQEAGNVLICDTLMQLYDRVRLLEWIDLLWIDKWPLTRREHRDLVAAVTAHDGERAVAVAQAHLRRSREDALRVVKAQYREGRHAIQSRPLAPPR
jgi:DNA-binding GntR family transcriptional regulator